MDRLRAALVQMPHGASLDANLTHAQARLRDAKEAGADLALLPEYFFATFQAGPPVDPEPAARLVREALSRGSRDLGLAVAAHVIERREGALRNLGVVYEDGRLVLEQAKVHPMPREAANGIEGTDELRAFQVRGHPTGMLVCADILYPEAARVLALQGAHLLLNPVMSAWRAEDDTLHARDALFVARAWDSQAFVLKAGGFRDEAAPPRIAGRSLAAAPWGILARAKHDFAEELLVVDLDFERLARFRDDQTRFPPRRPSAYVGLS